MVRHENDTSAVSCSKPSALRQGQDAKRSRDQEGSAGKGLRLLFTPGDLITSLFLCAFRTWPTKRLVAPPQTPSGHIKQHNGKFYGFAVSLWPLIRERINSHPKRGPPLLQRASNPPNRVVPNSHKSTTSQLRTKPRSRQHGACLHNMMSKLTKTRKRASYARRT